MIKTKAILLIKTTQSIQDITVCDYDLIGSGDPIGKIFLGWNQQKAYKPGFKHWKEVTDPNLTYCIENGID